MTPNVFPFFGTIRQCWDILYSEYNRREKTLGRTPFTFEFPKHAGLHDYTPKDGEPIYFSFRDSEHRHASLSIEVEVVPEGTGLYQIFVHAHGNVFEEPLKSILKTWMGIKNTMQAGGYPLSYGRLRSLHANYKKERGLPNHYERQYKKRYKKIAFCNSPIPVPLVPLLP